MSLLEQSELFKILDEELITPVYQPIVALTSGEVFGYESLSRGPGGLLAADALGLSPQGVRPKKCWLYRGKGAIGSPWCILAQPRLCDATDVAPEPAPQGARTHSACPPSVIDTSAPLGHSFLSDMRTER